MQEPDSLILRRLIGASPQFVSGTDLAKQLEISRVGVRSRLEKLREQGFDFDAVRNRGYRITRHPLGLSTKLISAFLPEELSTLPIFLKPEIDSTNSEAERLIAQGVRDPFVVISPKQTRGRGRLGRSWHSPEEGNIYVSFVFRPELPPSQMNTFTLWMGVNICRYLEELCDLRLGVKWPNDILAGQKKIAGILTEARIDSDRTRDLILGIGLNVNCDCSQWDEELSQKAVSLSQLTGRSLDLSRLAAGLINQVLKAFKQFVSGDYVQALSLDWKRYDLLKGMPIRCTQSSGQSISGVAEGIDPDGSLRLRLPDQSVTTVLSGEITLRT